MLTSPWSRLAVRAVLAGAVAFSTALQAAEDPFAKASLLAAITAGFWAAAEILTPINRSVGAGVK